MTTIDLSKYAAGKRLRCVCREGAPWLIYGKEYESLGQSNHKGQVLVRAERGREYGYYFSRFVPVEDEADVCAACGPTGCKLISKYPPNEHEGFSGGRLCQACASLRWEDLVSRINRRAASKTLSPGHAIREPVRLNEAQREAVGKPIPKPWAIPTGEATCAVCAADCSVRDSSDLFTTDDGKDYPLCADCWTTGDASDEWEQSTNDAILRKVPMSDGAVSALMAKRDAKVKRLTADLDDGSRMKAFPKEGARVGFTGAMTDERPSMRRGGYERRAYVFAVC